MKKIFLASVVALSVFVGAQSVSALTSAEAEAIVSALGLTGTQAATIRALAAPAAPATTFTRQMGEGAQGDDVSALQSKLIASGYLNIAGPTGYFKTLTKTAVQMYQASKGISATGYVGPMTLAALNARALVLPLPPPSDDNGGDDTVTGLEGTDGYISDVNKLSQYNNEEIGDGETDVKIVGFEAEASNDGDISLKSVKLTFDATGNTGSMKLADYVDTVKIWHRSDEIGSADASNFNKDSSGIYSKVITIPGGAVVKSDEKSKFYVTVDAVSNLDSSDISGDSWTVNVVNIRYEDGSGVVTTETSAGDLTTNLDAVGIAFVSYSTAANTELKFSKDSSSPETDMVVVDDSDDTNDVLLLVGKVKVEGTSDVVLNDFPVTLTVTGATDVSYVTSNLTLVLDGEEYSQAVASSSSAGELVATTTFENLEVTLDAGKTYTFKVLADINDLDTKFEAGDTIKASVTSSNKNEIDAENSEGDRLARAERSGSAIGEAQEMRTSGVVLNYLSKSVTVADGATAATDIGAFSIKFDVKAVGDTVYVASSSVTVKIGGEATTSSYIVVSLENNSDTDTESNGTWMIEEGDTESFTTKATVTLGGNTSSVGSYQAFLAGLGWALEDDATPPYVYTSNLDLFKTEDQPLN